MCGIAGYLSYTGFFDRKDLEVMTDKIRHRGPDAEGYYEDPNCGLGHRRLSIMDLSDRANQPMFSASGRYVIVYNGEVYNFQEIGARLKEGTTGTNAKLKTSSDTEVILEAFAQYGIECVHQLNGMFAFAIYDKEREELYLFRDRLGIKPLLYYWDGQQFAFSSELKSLQAIPKLNLKINRNAIGNFLHLGFIAAPNSIYEHIFKLRPGYWMKVSKYGIEQHCYWNVRDKITPTVLADKQQALVKMSDLLMSSVQYQLKSDVPFGVFLSGGIDSSLVTAQAVGLSSVKVNTFSIGFEENSHNESEYARAVAQYLGTNHNEFIVSYKNAIELIDSIFDAYDEPFADPSAIPTMLVSKLARQYVTVTLSGEGGDELFMGYGAYQWARRLSSPAYNLLRRPMAWGFNRLSSRFQRISQMLQTEHSESLRTHIFSQEQYYFSGYEISQLLTDDTIRPMLVGIDEDLLNSGLLHNLFAESNSKRSGRELNAMEQQALFDIEYYLPFDLLTKVDRASMRYSLETRVPYLDHRVVELAVNIAPELKYHQGIPKYILKEILYQYVPRQLFDRPKQGFAIPLNKWLRKELRYLIEDNLNPTNVKRIGLFNNDVVQSLVRDFYDGKDYLYHRIWLMIVLQRWLNEHSN